jgi:hypothetical protein
MDFEEEQTENLLNKNNKNKNYTGSTLYLR